MGIRQQIHDKLITDFTALTFEGGEPLFNNVQKYYKENAQGSRDCLIVSDTTPEIVEGQSAGNTQTTRQYGFIVAVPEIVESSASASVAGTKIDRLSNIEDALLDYLQKEPSNLNAWGNSNDIFIFKTRIRQSFYDNQQSNLGYASVLALSFTVFVNVVPQNL